jgi:hypothetical protein
MVLTVVYAQLISKPTPQAFCSTGPAVKSPNWTLVTGEVNTTGRIGIWVERANDHDIVAQNLGLGHSPFELVNYEISI